MTSSYCAIARNFAAVGAALFLASCGGSDRPEPLSEVDVAPPLAVPPQSNVNIANPTLTVAMNEEVSPGEQLTLVFSDEFDGNALDPEMWFFEEGDGSQYGIPGWGNIELQYYLPDSAQLANGMLTITAREQRLGTFEYTSARINTRDRFAFRYGRIEARMRLPGGQGLWPAFWLLSQDSPYGTWAASGEIDIMEAINLGGSGGNQVFGTIHYGAEFPGNLSTSETYIVPSNPPAANTVFPVTMDVDWVRVYSGEP